MHAQIRGMDIRFSFSGPFLCQQMCQRRQHKSLRKVATEGVSFSARVVGRVVCVNWQLRDATHQSIPGKMLNHADQSIYFNDALWLISGSLPYNHTVTLRGQASC